MPFTAPSGPRLINIATATSPAPQLSPDSLPRLAPQTGLIDRLSPAGQYRNPNATGDALCSILWLHYSTCGTRRFTQLHRLPPTYTRRDILTYYRVLYITSSKPPSHAAIQSTPQHRHTRIHSYLAYIYTISQGPIRHPRLPGSLNRLQSPLSAATLAFTPTTGTTCLLP